VNLLLEITVSLQLRVFSFKITYSTSLAGAVATGTSATVRTGAGARGSTATTHGEFVNLGSWIS
jgi:hypothetical protein